MDITSILIDNLGGKNDIDFIARFNGARVINRESVSQHSYWVTLFARLLMEGMEVFRQEPLNSMKYDILTDCLLHDYDETYTGDILYTFKHHDSVKKNLKPLINNFIKEHSEDDEIMEIFNKSKNIKDGLQLNLMEHIKKAGDWLSMVKYCNQECSLGNVSINYVHHCAIHWAIICINSLNQVVGSMLEEYNLDEGYFKKTNNFLENIVYSLKENKNYNYYGK